MAECPGFARNANSGHSNSFRRRSLSLSLSLSLYLNFDLVSFYASDIELLEVHKIRVQSTEENP